MTEGISPIPDTPSALTYEAMRNYAQRIVNAHQVSEENGRTRIIELAAKVHADIEYVPDTHEGLTILAPGVLKIRLSDATSRWRDRFTIAHELGHYFLHYRAMGHIGVKTFYRDERSTADVQANVFAAALLMPVDRFIEAFYEDEGSIQKLANRFEVSPAAVRVHIRVLNLK